ncbi:phytoene/squalene synthase family protein [Halomicrobium salinisoli]|uniref:phytoene/squalene synthase family protein n=1 Tax=Halomicrobium salinisoli TaxID=2878391 RepID=UPI001CF030C8|nr:phytoene/squalene synthase family protein [Halomicrobium salinisoli]
MSELPPGRTRDADRQWAFETVPAVSRTFTLTIDLLAEPMATWTCVGYLLCRAADTVEDEPSIPPRERAELLETFDAAMDPDDPTTVAEFADAAEAARPADAGADWETVDEVERTMRLYRSFDEPVRETMRSVVREMATGMADVLRRHADHGGLRLKTVDELEEYCWYVAGTVGELFTGLRAHRESEADRPDPEDARAFAMLLQQVNVAKDVRADWAEENNVYLPGEWLADEGLDHEDVADPEAAPGVANVVERVVDRATGYADGARRYLRSIPRDDAGALPAMGLPYLLALGTIRELRNRTLDAVEQPDAVKLSRAEVEALFTEVSDGVTQGEVDHLAAAVRSGPYHEG